MAADAELKLDGVLSVKGHGRKWRESIGHGFMFDQKAVRVLLSRASREPAHRRNARWISSCPKFAGGDSIPLVNDEDPESTHQSRMEASAITICELTQFVTSNITLPVT